jgi:hypothetical protein
VEHRAFLHVAFEPDDVFDFTKPDDVAEFESLYRKPGAKRK